MLSIWREYEILIHVNLFLLPDEIVDHAKTLYGYQEPEIQRPVC